MTEVTELVHGDRLGVVLFDVDQRLLHRTVLHRARLRLHFWIDRREQGVHMGKHQEGVFSAYGVHFVHVMGGNALHDLKTVVVKIVGVGEIEGDRIKVDLRVSVPDRIIFGVLGDVDQIPRVGKIGVSVIEKLAHALFQISDAGMGIGLQTSRGIGIAKGQFPHFQMIDIFQLCHVSPPVWTIVVFYCIITP